MGSINNSNPNVDLTVRVYDEFYRYDANVPSAEYDIVYSFFRANTDTAQTAGNMTVALFQVASITNIPVLELLDSFKGRTGLDLTVSMAYYQNNIRSRATLLGVNAVATPNYYAARAVLQ